MAAKEPFTEPTVTDLLADLQAVLDHTGRHAEHEQHWAGRCCHCSCGVIVTADRAPVQPETLGSSKRWRVTLADGFVCYEGLEGPAYEIASRHEGATVKAPS